jgi:hypothetical protein
MGGGEQDSAAGGKTATKVLAALNQLSSPGEKPTVRAIADACGIKRAHADVTLRTLVKRGAIRADAWARERGGRQPRVQGAGGKKGSAPKSEPEPAHAPEPIQRRRAIPRIILPAGDAAPSSGVDRAADARQVEEFLRERGATKVPTAAVAETTAQFRSEFPDRELYLSWRPGNQTSAVRGSAKGAFGAARTSAARRRKSGVK